MIRPALLVPLAILATTTMAWTQSEVLPPDGWRASPQGTPTGLIETEVIAAAEPGALVTSWANLTEVRGLAFRDDQLFGITQAAVLVELDPFNGRVLNAVTTELTDAFGLGWDSNRGAFIVTDPVRDLVFRITPAGYMVAQFTAPATGPVGAAYDTTRDAYWIADWEADRIYLIDPDDGTTIRSLPAPPMTGRIAGAAHEPTTDVLLVHGRDTESAYVLSAVNGMVITSFPVRLTWTNNGDGAAIRASDRSAYLAHREAATVLVVDPQIGGCGGTLASYGEGLAGSGGLEPILEAVGCPVATGSSVAWVVSQGRGGSLGWLLVGTAAASTPMLGGQILVAQPYAAIPHLLDGITGVPGDGNFHLPLRLPASPTLTGLALFAQAAYLDPGAPQDVSLSAGLRLVVGSQ
ncbi:MAG: hypothetical protein AAF628_14785 [Planctomycetota bacterium]